MYGMIKLGSRTELIIPADETLEITAKLGDKLCAGSTTLARYRTIVNPANTNAQPENSASENQQ